MFDTARGVLARGSPQAQALQTLVEAKLHQRIQGFPQWVAFRSKGRGQSRKYADELAWNVFKHFVPSYLDRAFLL